MNELFKDFEKKAEEIVSGLTLREKIGQLNQPETPSEGNLDRFKEMVREGLIGSILMSVGATAGNDEQGEIDVEAYNELQRIAVKESRAGIPILFGRDVIHGHRTVFPVPLAQSAAFNPELVSESYEMIAKEASNDSIHWTFTPMLDMCRDPRWGRIIEGPGEDPFVGACVAEAVVKGVQGENPKEEGKLLACAKHYVGYGASEGGRDYHRTEISDYSLYNNYLPAFRSAVRAGVKTVMSSFNDINGQPVTSSRRYLTDILRGYLGFDGFVVSDYDAVLQLIRQGVAETEEDCCRLALAAGLDMDMHDELFVEKLEALVKEGIVSESSIDEAAKRIIAVKLYKGLFEKPYTKKVNMDRTHHLKKAREMARESMVLLKNNGVLPLSKETKISAEGPYLEERRSLLGSWTIDGKAEETPTLSEALNEAGANLVEKEEAEVILLALGESWDVTGEAKSVSDISITPDQKELIRKAKETGKAVVGVLFCGRPTAMEGVADDLDALLYAWHSGSETAGAVCDLIFGKVSPSGRLPATMPRLATHIPLYYNVTSSGRPVNCYYGENPEDCYCESIPTPYYPFGFGLSYGEFVYSDYRLDKTEITAEELKAGEKITVSVTVKNKGKMDAKETVQLYIHDPVARMMRPLRELKGFKKVLIPCGEEMLVEIEIGYENLGYYLPNGEYSLEKGEIEVYIGKNCLTENKLSLRIK